jgi:CRP-like cAMP-binding protein
MPNNLSEQIRERLQHAEDWARRVAPQTDPSSNLILAALPDDAFRQLQPDLESVTLPQGTVCYDAGASIDQVYFPESGMISLVVTTREGDIVETSAIGREGAVGLQRGLGPRLSFTRAVVQIAGTFCTISGPRFEHAASQSAALRDLIAHYIETVLAECEQNAACNAIHDGRSRLSRWLLQCADRTGRSQLLLTQECLAQMLGVRRTTVTLLAQELQKHDIVRYTRGRITILNRAALENLACECYAVMKHEILPQTVGIKF